jgi:hypothetical protein
VPLASTLGDRPAELVARAEELRAILCRLRPGDLTPEERAALGVLQVELAVTGRRSVVVARWPDEHEPRWDR